MHIFNESKDEIDRADVGQERGLGVTYKEYIQETFKRFWADKWSRWQTYWRENTGVMNMMDDVDFMRGKSKIDRAVFAGGKVYSLNVYTVQVDIGRDEGSRKSYKHRH